MGIANKPTKIANQRFHFYKFFAARAAFAEVIARVGQGKKILLPAFIGYSVREGSGIFDPVKNSNISYEFYAMDARLHVNLDLLKEKISRNPGSLLLLVHYWGFIDPAYDEIKKIARHNNCILVEDFAHGLFTFFNRPVLDFDYGFFSLHKMFPYESGGVLLSQAPIIDLPEIRPEFFEYNLQSISAIRNSNYTYLLNHIRGIHPDKISILRAEVAQSVPQTFPILLTNNHLKDYLYFKMNGMGFGVVSLYHQLISEVNADFVYEHDVSSRILNLPIHQDVTHADLDEMLGFLNSACNDYESNL